MRAFLRAKRDGQRHSPAEIREVIMAYTRGDIPDYQVSAWLMAAFVRGLSEEETQALTEALLHSGRVFDWRALGRESADKHSTGGVGDKISLPLAPLVAACGVLVPMVSGRGLGHTGGTLDKLESIPGFKTTLSPEEMHAQLDRLGIVMVGQGPDLAPADGLLYSLRDVTSTVESPSFIVPSIVSKKIAEGAGAVVYDVKCGSGAFMRTLDAAKSLAERLVATTRGLGAKSSALVTEMSFPIGRMVGNALEVRESCDVLRGGGPADTRDLTIELAAVMLRLAGAVASDAEGRLLAERRLDDGSAWQLFLRMVEAQGGDPRALDAVSDLHPAPTVIEIRAERTAWLSSCDGFALGEIVVGIGGGRRAKADLIDPRVGLEMCAARGSRVEAGSLLARLHLASVDAALDARVRACFGWSETEPAPVHRILARID